MRRRTLDEMITYFNQQVDQMDIDRKYKIQLLGMITAIGFEAQKRKWIPVKERFPEPDQYVLVNDVWGGISVGWKFDENWWFKDSGESCAQDHEILAWMPLPEPYKEDKA